MLQINSLIGCEKQLFQKNNRENQVIKLASPVNYLCHNRLIFKLGFTC